MKRVIAISLFLLAVGVFNNPVEAKGILPQFRNLSVKGRGVATGAFVSPRMRADRRAIVVAFGNLKSVRSVSYALIYQTDSSQEGASGSIDSSVGNSATRELLFGTCSAGVCRYHTGIKNARLEVTTFLKNGKKSIKRFRIRV
ncbi:hypothetical protein A3G67_03235 [Candidatus Roizmanbacteria bacterium RIFCSPLOWO2_12_FULL_40_12]|uniref:Uncharacterized protein n=1 Tax=Candidatus Roizmanbacteria bacterium RIFCSPLOWO2_01_FULL_40_42 TaxID=1802066 RepID=A0A1F7J5F7_9BACT|nr:MAG: hypothetical protein A2779_02870 [Candidatus Roizmanbacteria bacterium RIFCSPHIGHO2_01_FULL_40_98]OGK28284.1 MAG: hypothetical protein A3C31_00235 [Candidatus Roizmanbacteria bacterium RIFCSPHIGHO2_02_FULL_40_53]OGK30520.1 MAG: hypothetical protein A2W49_02920 [Candidatus Roizmanbacteria bacterium RIFCSPHIGHO2_12_41_18]OGK36934.1 MAG: hypothetical protein A3E69_00495 [Candidatus Roizmanbacteria bacterium RIFCSPHIGHO2_12_FULL_40_130]OGK50840.1 MAG: hypothetical protein A3B50_01005 [Candi